MHLPQLAAQLAINLPQALERFGHIKEGIESKLRYR